MAKSSRSTGDPEVRLVFVGSPLLDVTSECDTATLDLYRLKPDDCVEATEAHDALFRQLRDSPSSGGGSALNAAKIAKWAVGTRGEVSFAGCVGEDEFAPKIRENLLTNGVEPLLVTLPYEQTGVCACLLSSEGHRSMVTRRGASALFSTDHLQNDTIQERLRSADSIFVVGYFLAHSPEVVRTLAQMCSSTQLFSLSLSATYICRDYAPVLMDILPRVDLLVGNEEEVRTFAKYAALAQDGSTIEACTRSLAMAQPSSSKIRTVVCTRGAAPITLVKGSADPQQFQVSQDVRVVDSVGCGDALTGALLGIYSLTKDMNQAVEVGVEIAGLVAQTHGCEPPTPFLNRKIKH